MKLHRAFLILATSSLTIAQEPAAPPVVEPKREDVAKYVAELKEQIDSRSERATTLVNEIMKLDEAVQKNADKIVGMLTAITDNQDSKTKVAREKKEVIELMARGIQEYARKRADVEEQLRRDGNSFRREELFKERAVMDTRIEGVIDRIVSIAVSMDVDESHEKYLVDSAGSNYWDNDVNYRKNPAYEQNRRTAPITNEVTRDILENLAKAKDRLDVRIRDLDVKLSNQNLTSEAREPLENERNRLISLKEQHEEQETNMITQRNPQTVGTSLSSAMNVESLIDSIISDARKDFRGMMSRYAELKQERDGIAYLKLRLDHAEKWLADHPAP